MRKREAVGKGRNPMSNKPPKDVSLQSTKQMLDELDALMERMLALPVNDAEEAPPFPTEVVKKPALSAKLTLLEPPPAPLAVSPPHRITQADSSPTEHPPLNPPHRIIPIEQIAAPQPEPLTNEIMPPSLTTKVAPILAEIAESPAPTQSAVHPLVGINQAFDTVTGELLRGPLARALLGFLGIALLLVATCWFLKDYLGWN